MKKLIAILPVVMFLLSVAFASASFQINETNVNATVNPGSTFSKQITLVNTESSALAVSFSQLNLYCISNPSETITATVSGMTIPANSTVPVSIFFSVPSNKLACVYHQNILATAGGFTDGLTADVTVNGIPNIDVQNRSITILKDLSTIDYLNVAIVNTGNVPLSIIYQYSNFSYNGNVLAYGSAGSDVVPIGSTHYMMIPLTAGAGLADGNYTSSFKINGTVNRIYTLSAALKTPVLSISLPEFTMSGAERNDTVSTSFKIKNNGDYDLTGFYITNNANSKYNVVINGVPDYLAKGQEITATISAFIPGDEDTNVHQIATLGINSNELTKTVPLRLNVTSKLRISEVSVTIAGSKKTVKSDGSEISDKDTIPGSTFSVQAKICNEYSDKDYSISNIAGDLTFESIDDGEDVEGQITEFDLDGDECKTVTASFDKDKISYLTKEGNYNLVLDFSGDDDTYEDITQSDKWTIPVEVFRKDTTSILFDSVSLGSPATNCGGIASLNVLAYNIGNNDNDAKLKISSTGLGIDISQYFKIGDDVDKDCDAIDEPDEKCIKVDHRFELSIPANTAAGTYPIDLYLFRSESTQSDKETVNLQVSCGGSTGAVTNTTAGNTNTNSTNTGNTNTGSTNTGTNTNTGSTNTGTNTGSTNTGSTGGVIVRPNPTTTATSGTPVRVTSVSGTNSLWIAGLIAGNVLLVIVIILVLLAIFRSKAV